MKINSDNSLNTYEPNSIKAKKNELPVDEASEKSVKTIEIKSNIALKVGAVASKEFNNSLSFNTIKAKDVGAKASAGLNEINNSQRAENSKHIFPGGVNGISPSDVNQRGIGDCYFLSSLAGLAQQRPRDIYNMIKDNGDGTATVKFPGRSDNIVVDIPSQDEVRNSEGTNLGENGSTWAAILEKAYVKDHTFGKKQVEASGFMIGKGISDVTNHGSDSDYLRFTRDNTTRNKIESKLREGKIIVASTFGGGDKDKNVASSHVYSVLGYDRNTDMIKLRNPWGANGEPNGLKKNDGKADGVFEVTMDEFNKMFSIIAYED